MNTSAKRAVATCALLATISLSTVLRAQSSPTPPPRQDTKSPTGVSYKSGAFSYEQRDLSIGGGSFPQGLTLDRTYLSSLDQVYAGYAGYSTQGWSNNITARFSNSVIVNEFQEQPAGLEDYLYSIVIGPRSVGFLGGSRNPTGGFEGSYAPVQIGGESLVFTGQNFTGTFTFTEADGTVLTFNQPQTGLMLTSWLAPDGTRLDYSYGANVRTVISNRGFALIEELGDVFGRRLIVKACAVNMTAHHVTSTSTCPAGVQAVTYSYASSSTGPILTGATDAAGQTTTYSYDARGHLACVKLPGQTACQISNTYGACYREETLLYDPPGMRWNEPVRSQVTATGETYAFSFPAAMRCPQPKMDSETAMTVGSTATTTVSLNKAGMPTTIVDPLGRTTSMGYYGAWNIIDEQSTLELVTSPEGDQTQYGHDSRGNIVTTRRKAKPDSELDDIVTTANFPTSCTSPKTCNKPEYIVDARGGRTDYTYDPNHGGVLTETGPADANGVRPQKRFDYAQRYAWIKNAGGGYSRAATPVWVMIDERTCRTTATVDELCVGGDADEVVVAYDHGPNAGPNNLLVRGKVATADGRSLRTCYRYDVQGNKIAETTPRAGLASCS